MILTDAILLGAGSGTRFSRSERSSKELPKQFQLLGAYPVFIWALRSLIESLPLRQIVIVVARQHLDLAQSLVDRYLPSSKGVKVRLVPGGARRQDSSIKGIQALSSQNPLPQFVLIHDACRPFIGPNIFKALREKIAQPDGKAWIPVIPITETLKKVKNSRIIETVDRNQIFRVQTPQLFDFQVLVSAFKRIETNSDLVFTDDASVLEYFGEEVRTFAGDERNIKLTYEFETKIIQSYLKEQGRNHPCESETVTTSIV